VDQCAKSNITVSSFGIGNDFDETLMRGISQHGRGKYCFIDSAENIPKYVSKAIHGLMGVIGTNVNLKVRGEGDGLVKKVGKVDDLIKGVDLADLMHDNRKQILVQVEVSPKKEASSQNIMNYELSYIPAVKENTTEQPKPIKLIGVLAINFTKDEKQLQQENFEVLIAVEIQEAAIKDKEISDLIGAHKVEQAVQLKTTLIDRLKMLEPKDQTGHISKMLKNAEKALQEMKSEKRDIKKLQKDIGYQAYQEEQDDDDAFNSGTDSDEGGYSEDEQAPSSPVHQNYSGSDSESESD